MKDTESIINIYYFILLYYSYIHGKNVMDQPNIVWTRIDERLLHGQIRITWGKHTEANLILIANDEAAEGSSAAFMQAGMKASAGGEYEVRFFTINKTIDIIHKASPRQKIFWNP